MCNIFCLIIDFSVLRCSPMSVNLMGFLWTAINLFDTKVSPSSKIFFKFHDLNKTVTLPILSISELRKYTQNLGKWKINRNVCVNYAWILMVIRDRCQVTIDDIRT